LEPGSQRLIDDFAFPGETGRAGPGWSLIHNGPWRAGPENFRLKTGQAWTPTGRAGPWIFGLCRAL